jgi:putative transposase
MPTAICGHSFFPWYNREHRHSGIGLMTPEVVHYNQTQAVLEIRRQALDEAFRLHPERFVNKEPEPPVVPSEVWINPPKPTVETSQSPLISKPQVSQNA